MNELKEQIRQRVLAQLENELGKKQEAVEQTLNTAEQAADDEDQLKEQLKVLQPLANDLEDMSATLNKYKQYNEQWRPKSKRHADIAKNIKALNKRHHKDLQDLQKRLDVSLKNTDFITSYF